MKVYLSDEQRLAIQKSASLPLEVVDLQTEETFYLVSAAQYGRVRLILEGNEEVDPSFYEFEDIELV